MPVQLPALQLCGQKLLTSVCLSRIGNRLIDIASFEAVHFLEVCFHRPTLLPLVQSGELDPTTVITHILGLGEAPEAYKHFNAKDEGWIKVLDIKTNKSSVDAFTLLFCT